MRRVPGPLVPAALAASLLYRAAVAVRNHRFDRGRGIETLDRPVVSVGNLVAGGAGKTPVVLALAERLQAAGFRPAVLSRGYGREGEQSAAVVSDGERIVARGPRTAGDEPFLLALRLPGVPVVVAARRAEAGRIAERIASPDLHLLDDGFQHRALARALDLVLVDAREGFGNGRLLPAGPLREPVSSLRRAHAVILTRWSEGAEQEGLRERLRAAAPAAPVYRARLAPTALIGMDGAQAPPAALAGARVAAFCGIANPGAFRETLESLGAEVALLRAFPDHHPFPASDVRALQAEAAASGAAFWVTTEKDWVRLPIVPPQQPVPLHVLAVRAELVDWTPLFRLVQSRL